MNNSLKDAAAAAYQGIGSGSRTDSAGISISIESDDNESTTAEHEHLLPATPLTSTQPASTSISLDQDITGPTRGARTGSSNILSSLLLARQRSYTPTTTSTAQINRRLQQSRSVGGGNSSMDDSTPAARAAASPANLRQLGFWRVNLNEMFSLSTAPSTDALRSLITHSNFRYQPAAAAAQPIDVGSDNQAADVELASTSAALRLNNRAGLSSGSGAMGRSVSMRESELQHTPPQSPSGRRNASVIGLPTVPDENGPEQPSETAAEDAAAAAAVANEDEANGEPPANELNVDDEHAISNMVVQMLGHFVRYLPVICIVLLKFIHDHLLGILDVVLLQAIMYNVNRSLRTQVARLAQRNYAVLIRDAIVLVMMVTVRLFLATAPPDPLGLLVPPPKKAFTVDVAANLAFKTESSSVETDLTHIIGANSAIPEPTHTTPTTDSYVALKVIPLGMLLYYVAVSDILIKLLTMLIKLGITMLPMRVMRLKVRARLYVLVEYMSQFYRALAPIRQWFLFLYESYSGLEVISGGLFSSLYLGAKIYELLGRGKLLKQAIATFRRNIDSERQPTKDELDAAGAVCPICHDAYNTPLILECGHIFCDECVSTWFKREQTCPMCRAKVSDDPTWQDGATSYYWQLF